MLERVADDGTDARGVKLQTPVLMGSPRARIGRSASGRSGKGGGAFSCTKSLERAARLGRQFVAGVEIGAQVVAGDARCGFDLEDEFEWAALRLLEAPRDLALAKPDLWRSPRLVTQKLDRERKHLCRRRATCNSVGKRRCVKHVGGSMRMRIDESTRKLDVQLMRKRIGSAA